MNAKDVIKSEMDMGQFILSTYLSDLNDADLQTRPAPTANPLAWQLGHLISSEHSLLEAVCPGVSPSLPAGFSETHSTKNAKNGTIGQFLKKDEYLVLFKKQRAASKKALDQLPEADLDKPGPEKMRAYCPTVGAIFLLIGSHPIMHSGQFATVRRVLGKPILI